MAADSFAPARVALGAQLAAAGNCAVCHTAPDGLETGFGLAYSSNISPDPQTGIGNWSEAAFARAMREGLASDGSHSLPAFPYTHFTRLTDDDVKALYAFVMTRQPVVTARHENTISFPINVRALQTTWKLLFFDRGVYQNVQDSAAYAGAPL